MFDHWLKFDHNPDVILKNVSNELRMFPSCSLRVSHSPSCVGAIPSHFLAGTSCLVWWSSARGLLPFLWDLSVPSMTIGLKQWPPQYSRILPIPSFHHLRGFLWGVVCNAWTAGIRRGGQPSCQEPYFYWTCSHSLSSPLTIPVTVTAPTPELLNHPTQSSTAVTSRDFLQVRWSCLQAQV